MLKTTSLCKVSLNVTSVFPVCIGNERIWAKWNQSPSYKVDSTYLILVHTIHFVFVKKSMLCSSLIYRKDKNFLSLFVYVDNVFISVIFAITGSRVSVYVLLKWARITRFSNPTVFSMSPPYILDSSCQIITLMVFMN